VHQNRIEHCLVSFRIARHRLSLTRMTRAQRIRGAPGFLGLCLEEAPLLRVASRELSVKLKQRALSKTRMRNDLVALARKSSLRSFDSIRCQCLPIQQFSYAHDCCRSVWHGIRDQRRTSKAALISAG
jgi:hypothetical protein